MCLVIAVGARVVSAGRVRKDIVASAHCVTFYKFVKYYCTYT